MGTSLGDTALFHEDHFITVNKVLETEEGQLSMTDTGAMYSKAQWVSTGATCAPQEQMMTLETFLLSKLGEEVGTPGI